MPPSSSSSLLPASSAVSRCCLHRPRFFISLWPLPSSSPPSSPSLFAAHHLPSSRSSSFSQPTLLLPRRRSCPCSPGSFSRPFFSAAAAAAASAAVDGLPSRLAEIVELFQVVPDPRAKYEQLLHYAKKLTPLQKGFRTAENKVHGCVSQVWVRAYLGQDRKVYFEAESDSMLTKGLAALLVEGLSGSSPSEVLRLTPDFIQILGLNQSLTPSRSNGFLSMFKLMQKKTLELAMESDASKDTGAEKLADGGSDRGVGMGDGQSAGGENDEKENNNDSDESRPVARQEIMRKKLETALDPIALEIEDVSYQHAGHAGVQKGASETHFNLRIVSPKFEGKSLVKRHRLIYDLLQEELQSGLHALSIVAKTPAEAEKA